MDGKNEDFVELKIKTKTFLGILIVLLCPRN